MISLFSNEQEEKRKKKKQPKFGSAMGQIYISPDLMSR